MFSDLEMGLRNEEKESILLSLSPCFVLSEE